MICEKILKIGLIRYAKPVFESWTYTLREAGFENWTYTLREAGFESWTYTLREAGFEN